MRTGSLLANRYALQRGDARAVPSPPSLERHASNRAVTSHRPKRQKVRARLVPQQLPPPRLVERRHFVEVERLAAGVDVGEGDAARAQRVKRRPARTVPGEVLVHRGDVEDGDGDEEDDGEDARATALPRNEQRRDEADAPRRIE